MAQAGQVGSAAKAGRGDLNLGLAEGEASGDEAACGACPYNALDPGRSRVGCQVQSPAASVQSARARLALIVSIVTFVWFMEYLARRTERELDTLAVTDVLTGLYNRDRKSTRLNSSHT